MSGWGSIYNNTRIALSLHAQRLTALQEQAASGARINRASDDPSDAHRVLKLRSQSDSLGRYGKNLDQVVRTLELSHGLVTDVSDDLQTVIQKLEQAASGTYNADGRAIIGEEINARLEQILSLVNTNNLGRFIFGGAETGTTPYVAETKDGHVTSVTYEGSYENLMAPVAPGVDVPALVVGESAFRCSDRRAPEFFGSTGAAAGSGTASVRGDLYLEITHNETTIIADPDAANLAISAGPDYTDTLLGVHDIVVDVPGKTIRLGDGPVVAFNGDETCLQIANADGDVLHVDVTGLNPALVDPATVTIRSTGYLSIDDETPPVELTDFTDENVAVLDGEGRVLFVNATGICRTGTDAVRVGGTFGLFDTLIHTRDVLLNTRGLAEPDQLQLVQNSLTAVREIVTGVTRAMTSMGGRLQALDSLDQSLGNLQATADEQAAGLEDADIVQLATDMARTQTLYEMTLATASNLLSLTLLDFI